MPLEFNGGMKTLLLIVLGWLPLLAVADNPYSAEAAIYKIEVVKGNKTSMGTGVLVSGGKILTNCHVVDGGASPTVVHRKTGASFRVTQYQKLGNLDACLLEGSFVGTPVRLSTGFSLGESV
jgi:S1-C subfamily serine protease